MKIIVSRNELLAAALFASNDESRFVLNGVCIEVRPENPKPVTVATDGRRLVAIETMADQQQTFDEEHSLLLRADFLKVITALSKACGAKLFPWLCIENNRGSKRVVVSIVGKPVFLEVEEGALIEGVYPDWRKVLLAKKAKRDPISEIGLNAEFIGDFAKAAKLLEAPSPLVQMNLVGKEAQVEVKIGASNFYGLVKQCQLNDVEYQPEFLAIVKDLPKPQAETETEEKEAA